MNILMLYPAYPDTFWSFKHALKFISKKAAFPPLGLLTIASMLPGDWNKRLVDLNVEKKVKEKDLQWADMVFISGMLVQKDSAKELIQQCKKRGKTVVAGGPAFTAQMDEFPEVDHFVLNEAEVTLPQFLQDLEAGRPKRVYDDESRPEITETPIPMWSLINVNDYATMPVQYSRGCPHDCEFCDIIIMNGQVPRTKTPEQMVQEFQALYDAGWQGAVFIVDDNFIGNKQRAKKMLPELAEWLEVEGEETLSCFRFPSTHRLRIRTTNGMERLNQEIKRRSRVVRIFPNPESCRRLAAARLKEHHEDWITGRRYIDMSRRRDENFGPPEEDEAVSPAA